MNPRTSTKGKTLQDYMPKDADRELFKERMLSLSTSTPGALHVTLMGSHGHLFSVEMFYVKFHDLDGRVQHLVGMREFSDPEKPAEMQHPLGNSQNFPAFSSSANEQADTSSPCVTSCADVGEVGGQPKLDTKVFSPRTSERSSRSSRSSLSRHDHRKITKGTPSVASGSLLSKVKMQRGSSSREPSASTLHTTEIAMDVALAYLLRRWVLRDSKRACCPWHAAIMALKRSQQRLCARQCSPDFRPGGPLQCRACGTTVLSWMLPAVMPAGQCDICGRQSTFKCFGSSGLHASL
mmetsp:Transcript_133285/g.426209  ORF Transcript_133285/g.426209 Transcript_133285/m.426209 type:complete len:294 (-) Transcript_133285:45-926(-)